VNGQGSCYNARKPAFMRIAPVGFFALQRNAVVLLFALLLLPLPGAAASDIAVVVRSDTPAESLSFSEVRKLLLGERQYWNTNLRVTLLIRAPAAHEREVVLKTIYRMSESQFRQYWISKVFRAEATSGPKIVYSNEMATELVSAIPGSVAFVEAAQVPKGLKVLRIDGKVPGDKDYPLK
jgi:ABC-type phosphate transport system substrate-binding protein